tara:strand:- start:677 stop:2104 length:1428 start_codon:yes stop_codon:yes gene_type:complete
MSCFKIISHASLLVEDGSDSLLIDPWLVGSCYWRSWWNYPPVKKETIKDLAPKAIYITHVHWDHWHGPSLKRFLNSGVEIITHDEPNKRSLRDLKRFGFKKIRVLKHGESFNIGKIKITPYQFGLFLNDSAIVVETPDFKLLNANDCKIAGASLEQIKNKHGKFDFAFRSHSSANDRVCYKIEGSDIVFDNPSHYTTAFKLFMDNVKPKYSIPFASNHCHLHNDVFHTNHIINDPFKLKKDIAIAGGLNVSELKVMLTGDSWSKSEGFIINNSNEKYFTQKDKYLTEYQTKVQPSLDKYYKFESNVRLTNRTIQSFRKQLQSIPRLAKKSLKNWFFTINISGGKKEYFIKVIPYSSQVEEIDEKRFALCGTKIFIPADIFNSAINMNMFHHSGISKRNKYLFKDEVNLKKWVIMNGLLEKVELEVFPLNLNYFKNIFLNYLRRWREIYVYIQAYILTRKGLKIYDVEEKILSKNI